MKPPYRQRQVAWYLVRHPYDLHSPGRIAGRLGVGVGVVKQALHKLRRRNGGLDPERLCPECLTHTRLDGVCQRCGVELPGDIGYHSLFTHEIRNRIHEGFMNPPIRLSYDAREFLRGDNVEKLRAYCLSRLDQLFKGYMPDHSVTNRAAQICEDEVALYVSELDGKRVSREDKLAIMVRTLLRCASEMPQHLFMWRDMIDKLTRCPQVVLYG